MIISFILSMLVIILILDIVMLVNCVKSIKLDRKIKEAELQGILANTK